MYAEGSRRRDACALAHKNGRKYTFQAAFPITSKEVSDGVEEPNNEPLGLGLVNNDGVVNLGQDLINFDDDQKEDDS
jgi:hypothetical protein